MIPTIQKLASIMMTPGKGILAADESESTMSKRLTSIGVLDNTENGRRFRDVLFTAPDVEEYLSGVILFDSTIRQMSNSGEHFARLLERLGIMPGIKGDKGLQPDPNFTQKEIRQESGGHCGK